MAVITFLAAIGIGHWVVGIVGMYLISICLITLVGKYS